MKVAVIGLGVGYALACALAEAAFHVVGVDISSEATKNPRRDRSVHALLRRARKRVESHLLLTTDYSQIQGSRVVIICVSSGKENKLELGHVEDAIHATLRTLKDATGRAIVLVYSTLPYGSSMRIRKIFQEEDIVMDQQIGYCYMPLMIAQGTTANDFVNPPFCAFGSYSKAVAKRARRFYLDFVKKSCLWNGQIPPNFVTTPEVAELAKLTANAFLSTKMSFANMTAELCEKLSVDPHELLRIVGSDWRIGQRMLKAGYAFGGVCFPRDLQSLMDTYREHDVPSLTLDATKKVNERRLAEPIRKLRERGIKHGPILILGKSYKSDVALTAGSPSLQLRDLLTAHSYDVSIYDPQFDGQWKNVEAFDAVIVTTAQPQFEGIIKAQAKKGAIVLDYRMRRHFVH